MLSPLATSSSTMIDDRSLRAYLRNNPAWNLDESAPGPPLEHSMGDKFLNSSVNFPAEMRSANLNQMVSSIIEENSEYHQNGLMSAFSSTPGSPAMWSNNNHSDPMMQYAPPVKNVIPPRQMKYNSSVSLSESGHPRNIPDSCSSRYIPPKDIQVLLRKGDRTGVNSLVANMSLQQFRQMIGLQRSTGVITTNDRRLPASLRSVENNRRLNPQHQPSLHSSSSSSSSSSITTSNARIVAAFKQQENKKSNSLQQWPTHETAFQYFRPPSNPSFHRDPMMMPASPHENYGASASSVLFNSNEMGLSSPVTSTGQEMSYFRSNRRTGVANTLHIAIEKCYEQLNYIRDSYAETESKIGVQILHKSPSPSSIVDITNTSFSTLSNNPSRVDRLIAEYHHEYNRVVRLHERIKESLTVQDIESTRQTLDEWFNAINIVQDRRRQEIDNAAEKCRSGEPRLPDEKDVLQLAEALRILRITTRKIRTILWYWLYWSTNATSNKTPLIARHHYDINPSPGTMNSVHQNQEEHPGHNPMYTSIIGEHYKQQVGLNPNGDSFYYPIGDISSPSSYLHDGMMFNKFVMNNPMYVDEDDQTTISSSVMMLSTMESSENNSIDGSKVRKPLSPNENNKENECNE